MGEAMMFRYPGDSGGSSGNVLITQIFKENGNFTVPKGVKQVDVRIFGGGGGGASTVNGSTNDFATAGGGGGWMNNAIINVTPGEVIPITIGKGGNGNFIYAWNSSARGESGGTTSFGSYLSAAGGSGGNSTWVKKGYSGQRTIIGGSGGSGGAAASLSVDFDISDMTGYPQAFIKPGDGYQFGGGGATDGAWSPSVLNGGGNGGMWGGGGGFKDCPNNTRYGGFGGQYGGNGYWYYQLAENGTNTMSYTNINENFRGCGFVNGGNPINAVGTGPQGHGGGGYGGNGGISMWGAGGGGGYGADGGNGPNAGCVGGGGGYGKNGYGGEGSIFGAGGGGAYGSGGAATSVAHDGGGGCGIHNNNSFKKCGNGASGICIIQYYL